MIEQRPPVLRTFCSSEWRTGLPVLFQKRGQHTLLMSLCETNSPTWGQLGRQPSSEAEQWVSISGSSNLIKEKTGVPLLNHPRPIFSLFLPSSHLSLLIFSLSCSVKIWAGQHTYRRFLIDIVFVENFTYIGGNWQAILSMETEQKNIVHTYDLCWHYCIFGLIMGVPVVIGHLLSTPVQILLPPGKTGVLHKPHSNDLILTSLVSLTLNEVMVRMQHHL